MIIPATESRKQAVDLEVYSEDIQQKSIQNAWMPRHGRAVSSSVTTSMKCVCIPKHTLETVHTHSCPALQQMLAVRSA